MYSWNTLSLQNSTLPFHYLHHNDTRCFYPCSSTKEQLSAFQHTILPFFLIVCYLPFAFIYSFSIRRWFWTKGGMHFSKVHWLDSFRICDRISIGSSSCYITNIHKTCFTIKMWSLFVRIKRLRYSSSLLHSFEYPRVENRTSVDCGKLFNKRLPSKHVNVRNWGAMSQQKQKWYHSLHLHSNGGIRTFFRNLGIL